MSEGPDRKQQLGRIQLQKKQVAADELDELGQLASELGELTSDERVEERELGRVLEPGDAPPEITNAWVEQQGERMIDLRRISVPLTVLSFVSRDAAREKLLLPLYADAEKLFVTVNDLHERQLIEELEFTSGRHVLAYRAANGALGDLIETVYAAQVLGQSSYRGPLVASEPGKLQERDAARDKVVDKAPITGLTRATLDDALKPIARVESDRIGPLDGGDSMLPPAEVPGEQKARILVVDDSDDIRRLLTRVFRERDYQVVESPTGADALQKVRECAPDLILLDAMLPDVHGFDVCRRLKGSRRYGHIPIVMLSAIYRGWRFAEDLRRSYGVDAFMEKPFRIGEVVAAVERSLAGKANATIPPESDTVEGPAGDQLKAGIEAYARGEVELAIDHLKRGIAIDPLAFRLHYHLGLLYGKQENVFEAITELETAVDLKPRDFSTLKNLAVLYQRAGFRLKAVELWERALGNSPDDATRTSIRNHLVSLL